MAASPEPIRDSQRVNNFDLIRLFGASQVAFSHAVEHLHLNSLLPLSHALSYLPGVPIFFAISGFLVSLSWERAPNWRQYALNRALRIYPALWTALLISVVILFACGVRPDTPRQFLIWIAAQISIAQFYNPSFIRGFGVGVINGSAWTIPVEIQFYALVPLLAWFAARRAKVWWILVAISALIMLAVRAFEGVPNSLLSKVVTVTLPPWLFFFLIGTGLRYLHMLFPAILRGKALHWAAVYALWVALEIAFRLPGAVGNYLNPVSVVLLATLTISTAFTVPAVASKLLGDNDISYGVYIYHMPFVNLILFLGLGGAVGFTAAMFCAFGCALLSWRLVEKPALQLKTYSVRVKTPPVKAGS